MKKYEPLARLQCSLGLAAVLLFLLVSIHGPTLSQAAESVLYKCLSHDGSVIYSDSPCGPNAQLIEQPAAESAHASLPPPIVTDRTHGSTGPAPQVTTVNGSAAIPVPAVAASSADVARKARALLARIGVTPASPEDLQSAAVRVLVKRLDESNQAWTATNPRWSSIAAMVRLDTAADGASLTTLQAQLNANLVARVQTELKPGEVSSLLSFFDGPTGAQYLEFQKELNKLVATGMQDMLAHAATQQPFAPSTDKASLLNLRLQTLAQSDAVIQLQQEAPAAARTGGDVSAHAGDGLLVTHIADVEGPMLDALSKKYAGDMPAFRAFNESVLGQRYHVALGAALNGNASLMVPAIMNFANAEQQKYGPKWRRAYDPLGRAVPPLVVAPGVTENLRARTPAMPVSVLATDDPARARSAITCVQAANVEYGRAHQPLPDGATQSEALRQIIAKCRQKIGLPQISQ